jgi:UDP-N-acetylmuramate--alanine ligase
MDHIHFIGIGGTGLSAIAKVLLEQGYTVSGSDLIHSSLSEAVERAGGSVAIGHQAENIQGADIVIRSSAIPDDNVEIQAALKKKVPVLKRSEFLSHLLKEKYVVAVAGSHGKTTTTAMIAWILTLLGRDPSFIVGGVVANLNTNAHAGSGNEFVIEADEYDYMFLGLTPSLAVVTNVEHDHPDLFPTEESFRQAFNDFVFRLKDQGTIILCGEDPFALQLRNQLKSSQKALIYGFEDSERDYLATDLKPNSRGGYDFLLLINPDSTPDKIQISIQVPGKHNVLNSLAAFAAVDQLGLDREMIARGLSEFKGSERRFDVRGEFRGVILVDDYAHHPTEIQATLAAARTKYPDHRIWAVWQPHTFSRTQTLFEGFTKAFPDADQVIVLAVYPAREEKPNHFDIYDLVDAIENPEVTFIKDNDDAAAYLQQELKQGDVLLVFTAGDAITITQQLELFLSENVPK